MGVVFADNSDEGGSDVDAGEGRAGIFMHERNVACNDESAVKEAIEHTLDRASLGPILADARGLMVPESSHLGSVVSVNTNFRVVSKTECQQWVEENSGLVLASVEVTQDGSVGHNTEKLLRLARCAQLVRRLTGLVVPTHETMPICTPDMKAVTGVKKAVGEHGARYLSDDDVAVGPGDVDVSSGLQHVRQTGYGVPVHGAGFDRYKVPFLPRDRYVEVNALEVIVCLFHAESRDQFGAPARTLFNVTYLMGRNGVDLWGLLRRATAGERDAAGPARGGPRAEAVIKESEATARRSLLDSVVLRESSLLGDYHMALNGHLQHPLRSMLDTDSSNNVYNLFSPLTVMAKITRILDTHTDVVVYGLPSFGNLPGGGVDEEVRARSYRDYLALHEASDVQVRVYLRDLHKGIAEYEACTPDARRDYSVALQRPRYLPNEERADGHGRSFGPLLSHACLWFVNCSMTQFAEPVAARVSVKKYPVLMEVAVSRFFHEQSGGQQLADSRLRDAADVVSEYQIMCRYGGVVDQAKDIQSSGRRLEELLAMEAGILDARRAGTVTARAAFDKYHAYVQMAGSVTRVMVGDDLFGSAKILDAHRVAAELSKGYQSDMRAALAAYGTRRSGRVFRELFEANVRAVEEYESGVGDSISSAAYARAREALGTGGDAAPPVVDYAGASSAYFELYASLNRFMNMNMTNLSVFLELLTSAVLYYAGTQNESWEWFMTVIHITSGYGHLRREVDKTMIRVVEKVNTSGADGILLKNFDRLMTMYRGVSKTNGELLGADIQLGVIQLQRATSHAFEMLGRITVAQSGAVVGQPSRDTHGQLFANTEMRFASKGDVDKLIWSQCRGRATSRNFVFTTTDPQNTNERDQTTHRIVEGFNPGIMLLCTNAMADRDTDESWNTMWCVSFLAAAGAREYHVGSRRAAGKRPMNEADNVGFTGVSRFPEAQSPAFDRYARSVSLLLHSASVHVALTNKLMATRFEVNAFTQSLVLWISKKLDFFFSALYGEDMQRNKDRLVEGYKARAVAATTLKMHLLELSASNTSYADAVSRTLMRLTCNALEVRDVWQMCHSLCTRLLDYRLLIVNQIFLRYLRTPLVPIGSLVRFLALPVGLPAAEYEAWPHFAAVRDYVQRLFEAHMFVPQCRTRAMDYRNNVVSYASTPGTVDGVVSVGVDDGSGATVLRLSLDAASEAGGRGGQAGASSSRGVSTSAILTQSAAAMLADDDLMDALNAWCHIPRNLSCVRNMFDAAACARVDLRQLCGHDDHVFSFGHLLHKLGLADLSRRLAGEEAGSARKLRPFVRVFSALDLVGGVAVDVMQHLMLSALIGDGRLHACVSPLAAKTATTLIMNMAPVRVTGQSAELNMFDGSSIDGTTHVVQAYRAARGVAEGVCFPNTETYAMRLTSRNVKAVDRREAEHLLPVFHGYMPEDWPEFREIVEWLHKFEIKCMHEFPYSRALTPVALTPGVLYPVASEAGESVAAIVLYTTGGASRDTGSPFDLSDSSSRFAYIEPAADEDGAVRVAHYPAHAYNAFLCARECMPYPVVTRVGAAARVPGRAACVGVVRAVRVGSSAAQTVDFSGTGAVERVEGDRRPLVVSTGINDALPVCLDARTLCYTVDTFARRRPDAPLVAESHVVGFLDIEPLLLGFGERVMVAVEGLRESGVTSAMVPLCSFQRAPALRAHYNEFQRFVAGTLRYPEEPGADANLLYVVVCLRSASGGQAVASCHTDPSGRALGSGAVGARTRVFAVEAGYVFSVADIEICEEAHVAQYIYMD